jgi:betaine lipid synthase
MLKLSAAHLREQRRKNPNKRLIWLDIGGGTGWNVEEMDKAGFRLLLMYVKTS